MSKKRYFLYLSYNGTSYHGWQIQQNAVTVQETLQKALTTVLRTKVSIMGSGRTDTGVHAAMQVVHFDVEQLPDKDALVWKLNSFLPPDIAVQEILAVKPDANTRFDALSRQYHYKIHLQKSPFLEKLSYGFYQPLDVEVMNQAAQLLLGEQDFQCFSRVKTEVNNFICNITEARWFFINDQLIFSVTANRFLRGMVRAIVGTLLDIGTHRTKQSELSEIIQSKDRRKAGRAVPPEGLYLKEITYPQELFIIT